MTTTEVTKSKADDYQVGDWFSRVSYCRIKEIHDEKFVIENETGKSWAISKNIVENECFAATQYSEEQKVNAGQLADLLEQAGDSVFCVTFHKKPNVNTAAELLNGADLDTATKRKKLAKEILAGEERVLTGYLVSSDPKMGRCRVKDLFIPAGEDPMRWVDTRTIDSLILKGIKYVRK